MKREKGVGKDPERMVTQRQRREGHSTGRIQW